MPHDFLGEPFVRFNLCRRRRGAKDFDAQSRDTIGQTRRQRIFRADHHKFDSRFFDEGFDRFEIIHADRNDIGQLRNTRIAR